MNKTCNGLLDISGEWYGRLFVLSRSTSHKGHTMWECMCECGNTKIVDGYHLRSGESQSCGCLQKERCSVSGKTSNRKHGYYAHPLYRVWSGIRDRCCNPNCPGYRLYGGRGITVCRLWRENPAEFVEWGLSNGYKRGLSVDRINVNGNYEPSNCRFTTTKVQQRNRRTNRIVELNGEKKTVAEWAEISGNSYWLIWERIRKLHWATEEAIFTPPLIFHL